MGDHVGSQRSVLFNTLYYHPDFVARAEDESRRMEVDRNQLVIETPVYWMTMNLNKADSISFKISGFWSWILSG